MNEASDRPVLGKLGYAYNRDCAFLNGLPAAVVGVTTPNVKNRTLVRRETGKE